MHVLFDTPVKRKLKFVVGRCFLGVIVILYGKILSVVGIVYSNK